VLVSMGEADEVVPIGEREDVGGHDEGTPDELRVQRVPGISHGPIIGASMADVFKFFDKHSKR